jgi:hypothetical protein
VVDLRKAARENPDYPPVLFVHPGRVEDGELFFGEFDPDARAIADPDAVLHQTFGLKRGSLAQMFGPAVWACGMRAGRKGHGVGRPVGDPWRMPGFFLVEGARIVGQYQSRHAGDHPDFASLLARREV